MQELVVLTLLFSFSPFSQTVTFFIFTSIFLFFSCLDPQFTALCEDMESSRGEGKRSTRDNKMKDYAEMEEEEEEEEEDSGEDNKKKRGRKGGASGGSAAAQPCCQVENCTTDMTGAKTYHRRHKVCELHAKAPVVIIAGIRQRFCQQCSRFHEISQFDEAKRSCRRRLIGHNERRRKSSYESHGDGSC